MRLKAYFYSPEGVRNNDEIGALLEMIATGIFPSCFPDSSVAAMPKSGLGEMAFHGLERKVKSDKHLRFKQMAITEN